MVDTVIKNCKVVTPECTYSAGIAIDGEKIVGIIRDEELLQAGKVIDAKGNCVIPGLVDPHQHLDVQPWDISRGINLGSRIQTETRACAFGGVTTINNVQLAGPDILEAAKHFSSVFEENGYVDLAINTGVYTRDCIRQMRELAEFGVNGFKFYIHAATSMVQHPVIDDGIVYLGFEEIAKLVKEGYKVHAKAHCENAEIFLKLKERYIEQGIEPRSWHEARPSFIEEYAMRRYIHLANLVGCPFYVVHMTIKEGVDIVAKAKGEGINVVAETCPEYLVLNVDNTDRILGKFTPPLRTKEDNERLWEGIRSGIVSVVGTDHNTVRKGDKEEHDLWTAHTASPIVENWLPIMLSEGVHKGRISLEKLVEVCCQNPAKTTGIFPKKGVIAVGSDADLVIVDLNKEATVAEKPMYSEADWNLFAGWKLKGWPVLTMLRGKVIMEQGKVVGKAGFGQYVPAKVK